MNLFSGKKISGRRSGKCTITAAGILLAAILAGSTLAGSILAGSMLSGCSGGNGSGSGSGTGSGSSSGPDSDSGSGTGKNSAAEGGSGSGTGGSGAGRGQTAKGRYMETELALPDEVKGKKYADCIQNADGSLTLYFDDGGSVYTGYTYNGTGWKPAGSINKLSSALPNGLFELFRGQDGKVYVAAYDEDYTFHLGAASDTGEVTEIFSEVFRVKEGETYGLIPDYINVLENGSLLVSGYTQADVFSPEGEKLFSVAQDEPGMDKRLFASVSRRAYLTISDGRLVRYDTETGEKTGAFDITEKKAGSWMGMQTAQGSDGSIYTAGQSGLYHTAEDGTVWEQLIDGSLNSMSRQDIYMSGFFMGTMGDYYVIYNKASKEHPLFIHYVFDEKADTVPPESLSVYSLRDNPTVRQAAAVLQKNNPQIRVEVRIAVGDEREVVSEDVIRALNTELLNGKGADVLILNGLPAESYREKGILTDMRDLFAPMKQDILPNVISGFTEADGSIYYMPARIILPVIYGEGEAVSAFQSLDGMKTYEKNPPLHVLNTYENLLWQTAYICYPEIFNEDGSVEAENLRSYLEAVKISGERAGIKTAFAKKESEELAINNAVIPEGFGRQGSFALGTKVCPAAAELIRSIDAAMLSIEVMEQGGYDMQDINGVYLPAVMAGISSSSQNEVAAKEFIRLLFSPEVQDESFYDGFTVRMDSYGKWKSVEKTSIVSVSTSDSDYRLEAGWPSMEKREELGTLLKTVDTPAILDATVMQMIVDGSKDYFDGKESLEEAVAAIENKMGLYMAEKK